MTLVTAETGEVVERPNIWLDEAVGHHVAGDLTADEALLVISKIKGHVVAGWLLIVAAHERKAHKALGYKTWEALVREEFDISRSRSYQLISQAKVVLEISEVSTMVDTLPNERQARPLTKLDDPEARAEAWSEANETAAAEGSDVTARHVEAAVEKRTVTERESFSRKVETEAAPDDAEKINDAFDRHADPRLTFRANFSKDLAKAGTLRMVDVDRAIACADADDLAGFRQSVQSIRDWCDRFLNESANSHLRRVK